MVKCRGKVYQKDDLKSMGKSIKCIFNSTDKGSWAGSIPASSSPLFEFSFAPIPLCISPNAPKMP